MQIKGAFGEVFLTLIRQVGSGFLQLLIVSIIAKQYGPEGNGLYSMALLFPFLLSTFLSIGVGSAIVYYVGSGKMSCKSTYEHVLSLYWKLVLVGLIVGHCIIYFGGEALFNGIDAELLYISLTIFPILFFQEIVSCFFQALQKFREFTLILLIQPVTLLCGVVIVELFDASNIHVLVIIYLFSVLVTLASSRWKLQSDLKFDDGKSIAETKKIVQYGLKSHLSNVVSFFNYRADVFLVNFFLGPISLGVYVLSVQISEKLWLISNAVSTVITPKLALLSSDTNETKKITPFVCRLVILLTLVGAFFLYISTKYFVFYIFGVEYIEVIDVMLYLIPGLVLWSGSRVISSDLAAHGVLSVNLYTSIAVLSINILGNIILIPALGLVGGALSTTLAYTFDFLVKSFYYSHIRVIPVFNLIFVGKNDFLVILDLVRKRHN